MEDLSEQQKEQLIGEIVYKAVKSSGPGGQHVNKTNSKIEIYFNIQNSNSLTEHQKEILLKKLQNKINLAGEIILISQKTRSQLKNKEDATLRFLKLIESNLKEPKKRINTKPTRASKEKRVETKKKIGEKKTRRKLNLED